MKLPLQRVSSLLSLKRTFILLLVLLSLVAGFGCAKKFLPAAKRPDEAPSLTRLKSDAHRAWKAKNFARSEMLYRRLLDLPKLKKNDQVLGWEMLSKSALETGHFRLSLDALQNWALIEPEAGDTWEWHETYATALIKLGKKESVTEHLEKILADTERPRELRNRAGLFLAKVLWEDRELARAMQSLRRVYEAAPGPPDKAKAGLEASLALELKEADEKTLTLLNQLVRPENQGTFPYTMIQVERARRLAKDEETWNQAWWMLNNLSRQARFADPKPVFEMLEALMAKRGRPGQGLVLVLPLSGPYHEIGWKILRGAGAAQWEALTQGAQINVKVINSDASGWTQTLEALGPEYILAGGPLQTENFKKIRERGLLNQRPFFTFLPGLTKAVEGQEAWRFFSSPRDQIKALVDFALHKLQVQNLAVLYPQESFGRHFSDLFWREAVEQGASVRRIESYPPKDPPKWSRSVAKLLDVEPRTEDEEEEEPLPPEPDFEAVFLPDGWSQAKLLVPQFFFYDEDRLLFLGPALWGQGLAGEKRVETQYFRLAVFPGAWWPENPGPGAESLRLALDGQGLGKPDFWIALGYDFIRFADSFGPLPANWDHAHVNKRLFAARFLDWGLAPLSWDHAGIADQNLYLFRPTRHGITPANPELLKLRLETARTNHEERVQSILEKRKAKLIEEGGEEGEEPSDLDGPPEDGGLPGGENPPEDQGLPEDKSLSDDEKIDIRIRSILEGIEKRPQGDAP